MPAAEVEPRLEQFRRVNAAFYHIHSEPVDAAELYRGKDVYFTTPRLFRVLNRCMRVLLSEADQDTAFNAVLQMVGESLGVSRAGIFLQQQGAVYSNTNEWCAPGVLPEKDIRAGIDVGEAAPSWLSLLHRDGMIVAGDLSRLPQDIQNVLSMQEVRALVVLPMWEGKNLAGYLELEDVRFHEWLPEEITLLRNLTIIMMNSLKKELLRREVARRGVALADILNNMDIAVYVTDIESGEILWANERVKREYSEKGPVEGAKCYELFEERPQRCDFCKVPALQKNAAIRQYRWEYYNRHLDRYFMVYDSLVRWVDGRRAHLEYAIDITAAKLAQKQLDYYSLTDSLTGTLSHKKLEERLRELLADAEESGRPVSVVSLDIDRLRSANEKYGYSFGDMLIANVVGAVCKVFRDDDIIGRTGGDSFTVLMPDSTGQLARETVQKARDFLSAQRYTDADEAFTINIGVVESSELPYKPGPEHVRELLAVAAARMREDRQNNPP